MIWLWQIPESGNLGRDTAGPRNTKKNSVLTMSGTIKTNITTKYALKIILNKPAVTRCKNMEYVML